MTAAEGQITLFDVDLCGPGWRAYDIGTFVIDEPEAEHLVLDRCELRSA